MAGIGSTNISFSGLRTAWGNTSYAGGSDPGSTNISLSEFRNAILTDGTSIPASGEISIKDDFRNKTFGSANNTFVTSDFNFNDDFSGEPDRLYPVSSATSTTRQTSSEHKFARLFHSNVSYYYPSILLCPRTGDPTIGTEDDAEVWIKMKLNSPFHFMFGIIHKQGQSKWINVASTALRGRHAAFNDRINIHTYGYITHGGHDIESSTKVDELMNTTINNPTDTGNYHNRIGITAGSGNGFAVVPTDKYYFKTDFTFYQSKLSISSDYYIGMKVNYYEITLTGNVSTGKETITNVQLNGSQLTSSDNVYTGMYLSSTDQFFPDSMIQSISYSTNTSIVMGNNINGTGIKTYGHAGTTLTFKAYGQRLEFQYTDSSFSSPKNMGPNHIILPKNYRTSSSGPVLNIDSWAFFVGDSTSHGNSGTFTIQNSNPSLYPDISSNFIEISNRFIASTVNDYAGAYDVSETQVGLSGNYNIYIGIKVTASTTFYNDICIAGVQVLSSSNNVKQTWIFNTTSGDNWKTYTSQISGSSSVGFPITPQKASTYTYDNITTLSGTNAQRVGKFSYGTSTGSNLTGAQGGISGNTGSFTVGNGTISQVNSSYYLFRETSTSTRYSGTVVKSPSITFANGDKIRVAHLLTGSSSSPMNANDSLYLGAYTS
tara:strand:+ start:1460 stop:3433 length:1974 start_codon:yes stop_codon:yes gene_type:complete